MTSHGYYLTDLPFTWEEPCQPISSASTRSTYSLQSLRSLSDALVELASHDVKICALCWCPPLPVFSLSSWYLNTGYSRYIYQCSVSFSIFVLPSQKPGFSSRKWSHTVYNESDNVWVTCCLKTDSPQRLSQSQPNWTFMLPTERWSEGRAVPHLRIKVDRVARSSSVSRCQ